MLLVEEGMSGAGGVTRSLEEAAEEEGASTGW